MRNHVLNCRLFCFCRRNYGHKCKYDICTFRRGLPTAAQVHQPIVLKRATIRDAIIALFLNSGKATFSISVPDNYTLGEVVSITISFGNSNTALKHGFELSALDAKDNHIGTFSSVAGDNKTQTR